MITGSIYGRREYKGTGYRVGIKFGIDAGLNFSR